MLRRYSLMIEMKTKMVALDQNNHCVVVLSDLEEKLMLPIWIGILEAQSITLQLTGEPPSRPLAHDLFIDLCGETGCTVDKVVITDLSDDTYVALIHLNIKGEEKVMDSRPSDAIAIALRSNAPIYMEDHLVEYTHAPEDFLQIDEEDGEEGQILH
jgi:bifunctional DNase/RNase